MLALNGLIFTELDYGFIELNLYLDVVEQNTIKKPTLSSVTAYIFTEFRAMHTVVYLKIIILIS